MPFFKESIQGRVLVVQGALGAVLGILILHPLTTFVYWIEFNELLSKPADNAWRFFVDHLSESTFVELVPMNVLFAMIGAVLGLFFGAYQLALSTKQRRVQRLELELNVHLPSLIESGETERVEFKSTMRWDLREQRSNKALEKVISKSLAGLMNHRGGSLLIGVDDAGSVLGIEADCQALKHKNTDGFERALIDLARTALGAYACTLIHCQFPCIDNKTICWLVIDQASMPIFFQDGEIARYFVRIGNSTREMDVREAHAHVMQRRQ